MYYAEHGEYTDDKTALMVDGTGNKYFTDYTVDSADASGFVATTTGRDDAEGITVTMTYTNDTGAVITYEGL